MHKQLLLLIVSIVLVIASLAGVVYLWWESTPQYAVLQVRRAYKERNQDIFNKYVDVANLVSSLTEEILYEPAERTPGLTKVQRMIGVGALNVARLRIDNSLIYQIQKMVKDPSNELSVSSDEDDGTVRYSEPPPQKLTNVIVEEIHNVKKRLKDQVYQRMLDFSRRSPDKIIYRILAAPAGTRSNAVKETLAECGLTGENFRSYNFEYIGPKAIAHFHFFSPRVNKVVSLRFELEHTRDGPLGSYRVASLVGFKDTLTELGYHTDEEVQKLMAYGLEGLDADALKDQAKAAIKNISRNVARGNHTQTRDQPDTDTVDAASKPH